MNRLPNSHYITFPVTPISYNLCTQATPISRVMFLYTYIALPSSHLLISSKQNSIVTEFVSNFAKGDSIKQQNVKNFKYLKIIKKPLGNNNTIIRLTPKTLLEK